MLNLSTVVPLLAVGDPGPRLFARPTILGSFLGAFFANEIFQGGHLSVEGGEPKIEANRVQNADKLLEAELRQTASLKLRDKDTADPGSRRKLLLGQAQTLALRPHILGDFL
jgi:hypothetical protein